jgi:hypothetical protein
LPREPEWDYAKEALEEMIEKVRQQVAQKPTNDR